MSSMKRTFGAIAACALAITAVSAHAAEVIKPQINEPLRDAAVTRAPDGTYYLTGTRTTKQYQGKPDFLCNDGIKLWSSKDLVEWKDEGLVWDMQSSGNITGDRPLSQRWRQYLYAAPDRPFGERVRGVTTPRVQVFGDSIFLTESMSATDVGVLCGNAGKPNGPYTITLKQEPLGPKDIHIEISQKFSRGPGGGSLFRDGDGTLYLVWGPGYLRKLTPKGGDAGEPVALLLTAVNGFPNADWCAGQFDQRCASLFQRDGKYILVWAAFTDASGCKSDDSFYAVSEKLRGPYSEPKPFIAGSGPVVLFDAGDKGSMVSYSVGDAPVIVPVKIEGGQVASAVKAPSNAAGAASEKPSAITMFDYAAAKPSGKWCETNKTTGRHRLVPVMDVPLAETAICKGGDGKYYMTGTVASQRRADRGAQGKNQERSPDFQNNDGIHLWRSADLNTWEYVGRVWSIASDAPKNPKSAWQLSYRIPGDNPSRTDLCRGMTAPQIHFADNTYWIAYSMNGRGTGLLKSTAAKVEGPYEDLGRITATGGSPSLFVDDDGSAWWSFGQLLLARLTANRQTLEGTVRPLLFAMENYSGGKPYCVTDILDPCGGFLFTGKDPKSGERRYYMSFSAITQTYGRANRETHITSAPSLDGPWKAPAMMVRHGGQNSVFAGPDGKLYASFAGADPMSVFRDRPGIVPLEPRNGKEYHRDFVGEPCHVAFKKLDYLTAVGPWDELTPDFPGPIRRDPAMVKIGDEFFVGFSPAGDLPSGSLEAGVVIYRSKDAKNWTAMHRLKDPQPGKLKDWEQYPLYTFREMKEDANWPAATTEPGNVPTFARSYYAWEGTIQRIKGEYYITTWMGGVEGKRFIGAILKSTSGKPEGPYVYHGQGNTDIQYLVEDDDGTVYQSSGVGHLVKMNDSLTGLAMKNGKREKQFYIGLAEGVESSGDCGSSLFKYKGRYFYYQIDARGDYGGKMYYSDTLKGPFHQFGSIPYGGNSSIAGPDANGIWHIVPQPDGTYPAANAGGGPVVLPLHFEPEANPPVVRYPWEDVMIGQAVYQ